jgi:hypothetical protein
MFTLTKELPPLDVELVSCVINRPRAQSSHTNLHKPSRVFSNEFQAPVATDLTSPDAVCDWCGQTAERRFTALGGSQHNRTGVFCSPCGQRFIEKIVNS